MKLPFKISRICRNCVKKHATNVKNEHTLEFRILHHRFGSELSVRRRRTSRLSTTLWVYVIGVVTKLPCTLKSQLKYIRTDTLAIRQSPPHTTHKRFNCADSIATQRTSVCRNVVGGRDLVTASQPPPLPSTSRRRRRRSLASTLRRIIQLRITTTSRRR